LASYTIQSLAKKTGSTVRNVRAYQDRGLLAPPRREGRHAFYNDEHVTRVRLILQLLKRGYTLASIKDLVEAQTTGSGLDGVLGVVTEVTRSWTEEEPVVVSMEQLEQMFGPEQDATLVPAIELGLIEPHPQGVRLLAPRVLQVGAELYAAGIPLTEVLAQLRVLRAAMEAIAAQFVELSAAHIWSKLPRAAPGQTMPNVVRLIRQLRPLALAAVDAEMSRALRLQSTRYLETIVGRGAQARPPKARSRPAR
jgi:DNA-binding transcriptional MerR regulator